MRIRNIDDIVNADNNLCCSKELCMYKPSSAHLLTTFFKTDIRVQLTNRFICIT